VSWSGCSGRSGNGVGGRKLPPVPLLELVPRSLGEYEAAGGGRGLQTALAAWPVTVIQEVARSGLRGRGGAGFPTGEKWRAVRSVGAGPRYAVCNAAEAEVVQPDPPRARLPRVGVVLAAGQSERLASVTGGGSKVLLRLGGLNLVERAVRSLLAAGLERVLVVVGHDAGPVATVVGRLGRDRVRVVYADRWADGNGASLAGVQGRS
jgi:hypothetical protein